MSLDEELRPLVRELAAQTIGCLPENWTEAHFFVDATYAPRLHASLGRHAQVALPPEELVTTSRHMHEVSHRHGKVWSTLKLVLKKVKREWGFKVEYGYASPIDLAEFSDYVIKERQRQFEGLFGPFPHDVQLVSTLFGVWPGGCLVQPTGTPVSATFGLSNPDMPTRIACEVGRTGDKPSETTLKPRIPRTVLPGLAGYGHEVLVHTPEPATWPLRVLTWMAQREILGDLDILGRAMNDGGFTVESLPVGVDIALHFLVTKARPPFPESITLPNGTCQFLVAMLVTQAELDYSREHGPDGLQDRLSVAGVGQMSSFDRKSVV